MNTSPAIPRGTAAAPTQPAAASVSSRPSTRPPRDSTEISVTGIARAAGVDLTFLYRHRDLLEQLHAAEAQPPQRRRDRPARQPRLLASRPSGCAGTRRSPSRPSATTGKRLSQALGEKAWRESGLGAPDEIDALKHRIVHLEQHVADLRLQLDERADELAAAHAANCELRPRLNQTRWHGVAGHAMSDGSASGA